MGIFDFFKKKPQERTYEFYFDIVSDLLKLMERKKRLVDKVGSGKSVIDLEFDALMKERMELVALIKCGAISFLGNELKVELLKIFDDELTNKEQIMNVWKYLQNEKFKLQKLL
jgi:hypothetical protein